MVALKLAPLTPLARTLSAFVVFVVVAIAGPAVAQGVESLDDDALKRAQVERVRHEAAKHLHLRAYDLIDELVYGLGQRPPFDGDTAVVLADVTVPFGYGSGLEALIENHLAELVLKHPEARLRLAHCPACAQVIVHADAQGTVVSRGIDQPEAMRQAGADVGAKHALFIDIEAEGSALVLRARITTLDDELSIVASKTLSSSTSSAALLRSGDYLVSADVARAEYKDALEQNGPIAIPAKLMLFQFAPPPPEVGGIANVPIIWVQSGAEFNLNHARDWSGSLLLGGTFVPQLYNGLMLEGRVNRLLTGAAASLTQPNLYGYVGASVSTVTGPTALLLRDETPNIADLIGAASGLVLQTATWPSFSAGLDLRVGRRVGAAFFVATTPTLANAPAIGRFLDFGVVQVHAIGGEVTLWF